MPDPKKNILIKILYGDMKYETAIGMRPDFYLLEPAELEVDSFADLANYKKWLEDTYFENVTIEGMGVFNNAKSDAEVRNAFFNQEGRVCKIVIPEQGVLDGIFKITKLEYSGTYQGEATFRLILTGNNIAFSCEKQNLKSI